ncbi:MAG TPA: DNA gyrase inhibitor YacG [Rhizomicrobium sp.]|jgi:hypothetical protein
MSPHKSEVRRCPICGRPRIETFKPFCSKKCADIDLGRWLEGRYAIPAEEADDADSTAEEEGERKE